VWLGVEGTDLDTDTANDLHLEGGALVGQVVNGSPASRAGMLTSDIIVAVDGTSVSGMEALLMVLRNKHPGDIVTLDVLRHGARTRLRVILGTRPAS
jgi:S1-C subfamily serine protease